MVGLRGTMGCLPLNVLLVIGLLRRSKEKFLTKFIVERVIRDD